MLTVKYGKNIAIFQNISNISYVKVVEVVGSPPYCHLLLTPVMAHEVKNYAF